ncbi:MAG: preprotein translocase subunit SecA [Candidatus Gracilibacteria bacterium]
MMGFLERLFGDDNQKMIARYQKDVAKIRSLEASLIEEYTSLEQVQSRTKEFMSRFVGLDIHIDSDRATIKSILEEIKHEAIALHSIGCRLLSGTTHTLSDDKIVLWNMVPYDVQIIGALALNDRRIAEMRTGEGKTLVATIAAYLNALTGYPVHVVTVNDYLARRDSEEMGILYKALGLSVGVIVHNQSSEVKKEMYRSNIVYATNNELGFDYLRDNMVSKLEDRVMSPLSYALIDEVDSILIDEARTPLIISAPDSEPTNKYMKFAAIARSLEKHTHYKVDEKARSTILSEEGIKRVEEILGVENIYTSSSYNDLHHIENALKAESLFERDKDYIVRNNEILIVDEHTGRVLSGRRYSDGLHQAIEAREGVEIKQETKTLASITFQNYFRLYKKLAGMTGTAKTEEEEFYKIYSLEVLAVPTNKPLIRDDRGDLLFKNEVGKFEFLVNLIAKLHSVGQPILVGTVSVAKSEYLSDLLKEKGVPHEVLNAKQDEREAEIIAKAGSFGGVTIATNMAGRGTDIKLSEEVKTLSGKMEITPILSYDLGGLFVIGTEKHETRRIDNQLRGRSGRQGDPGTSQFLVSPNDDIMRIFGGDKLFSIFNSPIFASVPADEPLAESGMLTKRITSVQKQVEGRNFDIRKHVLEYDDVINQHRLVIYARRNKLLKGESQEILNEMIVRVSKSLTDNARDPLTGNLSLESLQEVYKVISGKEKLPEIQDISSEEEIIESYIRAHINNLRAKAGEENVSNFINQLMLQSIDLLWMQHIDAMTHLREEVAFESYAQKNPLIVYRERAYDRFMTLISDIDHRVVRSMIASQAPEPVAEAIDPNLPLTVSLDEQSEIASEFEEIMQDTNNEGQENEVKNPVTVIRL